MLKAVVTIIRIKDLATFNNVVEFEDERDFDQFVEKLDDAANPDVFTWTITTTDYRSLSRARAERMLRDFGITLLPAGKKEWRPPKGDSRGRF